LLEKSSEITSLSEKGTQRISEIIISWKFKD